MSLLQLFSILRARRGLAALILLATMGLALAWVLLHPHSYTARAPVLVDVRMDPVGATPLQGMVLPSFASPQIALVKSEGVAERPLKLLPPGQSPMKEWREQAAKKPRPEAWLTRAVQTNLDVK